MIIVGFKSGGHDPAMAILKDGVVVCAAEEERFTRVKHSHGSIPIQSIKWGLSRIGIKPEEVDYWAVHHARPLRVVLLTIAPYMYKPPKNYAELRFAAIQIRNVLKNFYLNWLKSRTATQRLFQELGIKNPKIFFVEHHVAHGLSASMFSGIKEGLSLSIDGKGDGTSLMVATFANSKTGVKSKNFYDIKRRFDPRYSLGLAYTGFTKFLGFEPNDAEYKVMGLASYGTAAINLDKIFGYKKNGMPTRKIAPFVYNWRRSKHLEDFFGLSPRSPESQWEGIHADIAASAQKKLEESALAFANRYLKRYNKKSLVLSGGVCLNVKMNMVLRESLNLDEFYVQPVSSDAGLPLGCVAFVYRKVTGLTPSSLSTLHLGPDISEFSLEHLKEDSRIEFESFISMESLCEVVAREISNGAVVAWMQGQMEFGPRSLGARSILADPRRSDNRDRVNVKIKFRELFRPFCPSMLKDDFEKYVEGESAWIKSKSYHFMIEAFKANELAVQEIPAVIHVDGTFRPQVVEEVELVDSITPYQLLLKKFREITGIGVLLNTSLNRRGEPIACTPEQGMNIFHGTDLDLLVINQTIFRKRVRSEMNHEN